MKFHMLFEQSGTFKNIFKSYGHEAYDYDILNDYGQTDFQIDLFKEIEHEYENIVKGGRQGRGKTIFSDMKPETDFIMAFFPCTYFSELNEINFKFPAAKNLDKNKNIKRILKRAENRFNFFTIFIKFCFIVDSLKIKTIIENPKGIYNRTYLELYSPYRPKFADKDRTLFGDKFRKPTNYFSINFEMKENFIMYDEEINKLTLMDNTGNWRKGKKAAFKSGSKERSEITPRYANNFYKRFIEHQI